MSNNSIGIITEQGDLGLGFDPVNDEEAQAIKESAEKEKDSRETAN